MLRRRGLTLGATVGCLLAGACAGNGALFDDALIASESDAGPTPSEDVPSLAPAPAPTPADDPLAAGTSPTRIEPSDGTPGEPNDGTPGEPSDGTPGEPSDGTPGEPSDGTPNDGDPVPAPDAGAPVTPARDVVADGPAAALPLLGVAGGDPRLGVCSEGVVIGVATTANPSAEVFGQRLTFVAPVCGTVVREASADGSGRLRVTRDDALVAWATTDGFFGLPATEVPDPRLLWVAQPETVCPEATPIVVGLSGAFDPVAPDVPDTVAIRSLFIECAPLAVGVDGVSVAAAETGHQLVSNAQAFAASGAASYRSACEAGAVTTQIQVHAGFWLDGFVLGCSSLRIE